MKSLTKEVKNVQNSALGAVLLWKFTKGYYESSEAKDAVPLQLLFLVLPIVLHKQIRELINGTRKSSGLRKFVAKFDESKNPKQNLIFSIHDRSLVLRELSLESLQLSVASGLLSLVEGKVFPINIKLSKGSNSKQIKNILKSAERLGHWCGLLTPNEIALILKVRF